METLQNRESKTILSFGALDRDSLPIAGGKAANLGELTRAGFPVPNGFCVTTAAYAAASSNGATIEDIAGKLYLSEGTVRNYLSTAIKKLGTRNRVEASRLAEKKGWL